MDTRYINEFIVLAKNGNFSDAADKLYISQSSLSKHINAIETELGCLLLNRTNKGVELNEAGKLFLDYAKKFMGLRDRLYHDISTRQINQERVIPVASEYQRLEPILKEFHKGNEGEIVSKHYAKGGFHGKIEQKAEKEREWDGIYFRD